MAEHGLRTHSAEAILSIKWGEKFIIVALLFILLTAAAAGVTNALVNPDLPSLWESLLCGLILGWGLALVRQSARQAALIAVPAGLIFTLLFATNLDAKVAAAAIELFHFTGRISTARSGIKIDLIPLAQQLAQVLTSTEVVFRRVLAWVTALTSDQPVFDPVAAAFVWCILGWIVAAWAGWIAEARKNALLAISPAILFSMATLSYGRLDSPLLYLMLGASLALLAMVQHDQREREWDTTYIAYPAKKWRQIGNVATLIAIALVTFSYLISSISFQNLQKAITTRRGTTNQRNNSLAKSLGILSAPTATPNAFEAISHPGLPRDLLIGSGPELSERVVMSLAIENLPSFPQGEAPLNLYWRSLTYDIYTNHGWSSSETEQDSYPADQLLQAAQSAQHLLIQQSVRPVEKWAGIVYAAGEPIKVSAQSNVAWRSNDDLFGIQIDSTSPYMVDSLIPIVNESSLRAAGQKYPGWVKQRYLALPPLPERVKQLAIDLTASDLTPYDRARSIERYLRTFPYSLDVPRSPLGQDLVDYFLFNLRKGYCDYYASAMVVLARAAGVPARLVIGFATGEYNLNSKRFVVTEADAHSWAEVYFPKIGWVPFEPTASRPLLENAQGSATEATQIPTPPSLMTPGVPLIKSLPSRWFVLPAGLALALVILALWSAFDNAWLRSLSDHARAVEVYRRLRWYAKRLAVPLDPGGTPLEFCASLNFRLQDLMGQGVLSALTLQMIEQVHRMIEGIVVTSYHPLQPKAVSDLTIYKQWKSLRWQLRLVWIMRSWKALSDPFFQWPARLAGPGNARVD